jgi:hypothetical protein
LCLHLGSQLLLELLVLADTHASALSGGGFGALGSQATRVTRCRRKLGMQYRKSHPVPVGGSMDHC